MRQKYRKGSFRDAQAITHLFLRIPTLLLLKFLHSVWIKTKRTTEYTDLDPPLYPSKIGNHTRGKKIHYRYTRRYSLNRKYWDMQYLKRLILSFSTTE
jgi:hypothetical protein